MKDKQLFSKYVGWLKIRWQEFMFLFSQNARDVTISAKAFSCNFSQNSVKICIARNRLILIFSWGVHFVADEIVWNPKYQESMSFDTWNLYKLISRKIWHFNWKSGYFCKNLADFILHTFSRLVARLKTDTRKNKYFCLLFRDIYLRKRSQQWI